MAVSTITRVNAQQATPVSEPEFSASAVDVYPTLTITTSNGGPLTSGTIIVTDNADDSVVYSEGVSAATPSPKIVNVPPVADGTTLTVTIQGVLGYADFAEVFTVTTASPAIAAALTAVAVVGPTMSLETSDGGDIPAGTIISITNAANDQPLYGEGTVAATTSPRAIPFTYVNEGTVVHVTVTDAAGYEDFDDTFTITSATSGFTVTLVKQIDLFVGIEMSDSGPIPYGLTWSLNDGNTVLQTGDVPGGVASGWQITLPDPEPAGSYVLWITGNGYTAGQTITPPAWPGHVFTLNRLTATLNVTLDTDDDHDIPVGTTWELRDAGDTVVQSGTLTDAIADGGTLPTTNPVEYGTYTLEITAPGYIPFTTGVNVTDPWTSTYNVTANLELQTYPVTVGVSMSDSGPIPAGLSWTLFLATSPEWTIVQTGEIPAGAASGWSTTLPDGVPAGDYQLWITGNGYDEGIVLPVPTWTSHDFVLDRKMATVTVTLDTDDDNAVPAGTTWELRDQTDAIVQSGTLVDAIADGGTLPITNPIEFGTYELVIDAPGYLPSTTAVNANNPWFTDYDVTATLEFESYPISLSVSMSDSGTLPYGLEWSLRDNDSTVVFQSGDVPGGEASGWSITLPDEAIPGTYTLWVTGNGYSSGVALPVPDWTSHDFVLDRLLGNLTVTLDTDDDADVPAGTAWDLRDVNGVSLQSGTIDPAVADGSTLPITNPIEYGVYTLEINAPGYFPYSTQVNITDPWTTTYEITAELNLIPTTGDVSLTLTTEDGGDIPTGTRIQIGNVVYEVVDGDIAPVSAADITSGTTVTLSGIAPGEQPITITNAAPYQDATSSVEVVAGETSDSALTLQLAPTPTATATPEPSATTEPTETPAIEPTATSPAEPTATETAPVDPTATTEPSATSEPTEPSTTATPTATSPAEPTATGTTTPSTVVPTTSVSPTTPGGSTITTLPNTGQTGAAGQGGTFPLIALGGAMLLLLAAIGLRRRTR